MAILEPGKPVPLWVYGAGTVVVVGGYFLYRSRRNAKAAAAAAATPKQQAATATSTPVVPAASYGNADNAGALANITQQLQSLNAAQAATQGAAASAGVVPAGAIKGTPQNQVAVGGGFQPSPTNPYGAQTPISSNNGVYRLITDLNQAASLGVDKLYYQPVPGVFSSVGGSINNVAQKTPIFQKVA